MCQASLHFVQKNSRDLVFGLLASEGMLDGFPFCDRRQRRNSSWVCWRKRSQRQSGCWELRALLWGRGFPRPPAAAYSVTTFWLLAPLFFFTGLDAAIAFPLPQIFLQSHIRWWPALTKPIHPLHFKEFVLFGFHWLCGEEKAKKYSCLRFFTMIY